jgi:hypothetical protein
LNITFNIYHAYINMHLYIYHASYNEYILTKMLIKTFIKT